MNPVQMRSWRHRRCSANHLGFAFLRRRHDAVLTSPAASLVGSLHGELEQIRRSGIAGELAWGMGAIERIPGAMPMIERLGWFTPTASLTCLSSMRFARRYGFHTGPLVAGVPVRRIGISAPLQAGGELAVTIWDLGDFIGWTLRFADTQWTDHPFTQSLLSLLHAYSNDWAAASATPSFDSFSGSPPCNNNI